MKFVNVFPTIILILFLDFSFLTEATTILNSKPRTEEKKKKKEDHYELRRASESGITIGSMESSPTSVQPRIVGGTNTNKDQYPYFVHWSVCGGTLIHPDIVLSAAHCSPICEQNVYIGAYDKENLEGNNDVDKRTIVERRVHPNYNYQTIANDFMILRLNRPSTKRTVNLPTTKEPNNQDWLTVIGFGATFEGDDEGSRILQEVDIMAISHNRCNEKYLNSIEKDIMFCAGDPEGEKDSCQGDSGGPILKGDTQVGVVSWGRGCGHKEFPGVYARNSYIIDWIKHQICELSRIPPSSCPSNNNYSPSNPPPGTVPITVTIELDQFPEETGMTITRKDDNSIVTSHPPGSFACAYIFEDVYYLFPGEYIFNIIDIYADGMCCDYGTGNSVVRHDTDVLLETEGKFSGTNVLSLEFTVPPAPPSPNPPPTPAGPPTRGCPDTRGQKFHVDDEVGERDCQWLNINMERYNYLCQFVDVADACRTTCNTCHYFEPET